MAHTEIDKDVWRIAMQVVKIEARIAWQIIETEGSYIAVCDQLGLTVSGDTHNELGENIGEVLQMLFEDLVADQQLDQFLKERGWERTPGVDVEGAKFDIPWELLNEQSKANSQRASYS